MKIKCLDEDCQLEFEVNVLTGKHTINKAEQLCCPYCHFKVRDRK